MVDDDVDDRELFLEALNEIDGNFKCHTAPNGEEALKLLSENLPQLPDYIFLDLNMPRLNGKQCLIEIKKRKEFSEVPVIIYSTSSAPKDIEETTRLGASHFLTKPSSFEELRNQLSAVLRSG